MDDGLKGGDTAQWAGLGDGCRSPEERSREPEVMEGRRHGEEEKASNDSSDDGWGEARGWSSHCLRLLAWEPGWMVILLPEMKIQYEEYISSKRNKLSVLKNCGKRHIT